MQLIVDKDEILEAMRGFIGKRGRRSAELIYQIRVKPGAVWNGWTVTPGGLEVVGARPLSIIGSPPTGEHFFDLTNSDSDYTRAIGRVSLADIESITLLQ